jgi:hypothetical protein
VVRKASASVLGTKPPSSLCKENQNTFYDHDHTTQKWYNRENVTLFWPKPCDTLGIWFKVHYRHSLKSLNHSALHVCEVISKHRMERAQ